MPAFPRGFDGHQSVTWPAMNLLEFNDWHEYLTKPQPVFLDDWLEALRLQSRPGGPGRRAPRLPPMILGESTMCTSARPRSLRNVRLSRIDVQASGLADLHDFFSCSQREWGGARPDSAWVTFVRLSRGVQPPAERLGVPERRGRRDG